MNLNKVMLIGRLTRDPEARTTPNGRPVTSFSIATNRVWNDASGNKQEATEYHNIVLWGKLAEISAQYLVKGQEAYVEGRLQTRSWEGQDGVKRYTTEIVADTMQMGAKAMRSGSGDGFNIGKQTENSPANSFENTAPKQPENGGENANLNDDQEIKIENIPF